MVSWSKRPGTTPHGLTKGPYRGPLCLGQHCLVVCVDSAGDGPCVEQKGIDDTIVPYLDKLRKVPTCTFSELINGVHDGGVRVCMFIDGTLVGFRL